MQNWASNRMHHRDQEFFHCCRFQVEALLDRIGGEAPVMQYVARSFQELGYGSWAYRVVNSAGLGDVV